MQQFSFSKNAARSLALKKVLVLIPLISIACFSATIIVNNIKDNAILKAPILLFVVIGILLFILIGGFFKARKTIQNILLQTVYEFSEDFIEKKIPNGENTRIYFREIRRMQTQNSGLLIKAKDKQIKISKRISNYKVLEKLIVQRVHTGIIYNDTKFKINNDVKKYLAAILTFSVLLALFLLEDKYHKLYLGIPLICGLVYTGFAVNRNKNAPTEIKNLLPKLIFITLGIIGFLIFQFV